MRKSRSEGPVRAAIYSRISLDKEGDAAGVRRQEEDCAQLASRLGYVVVDVFQDNDISASTRSTKPRPRYDAMISGARAGDFDAILAYSNSRLTRRPREFEDLIDLAERYGTEIHTVASGSFDLSTADGRRMARFLAGEAAAEAERTGERVKRAKDAAAAAGKYRGGVRPFGYRSDGMTLYEPEARRVREATRAIIEGRTLASIAREWNAQGLSGTRGRPWTYNNLRDMLLRPRNAGLLARGLPGRKGRGAREPDWSFEADVIGKAAWPPIVPVEEWRAMVEVLIDPARHTGSGREGKWLGSGIYRCGVPTGETDESGIAIRCGAPLRTAPYGGTSAKKYERRYLYRCAEKAHLTIRADQTDEYVRGYVAAKVRDPRTLAAFRPDDPGLTADRDRRSVLLVRLDSFLSDYAAGRITGAQLQRATSAVNSEIAEIDGRLAKGLRETKAAEVMSSHDPGAAFLAAPIDIQRSVLALVASVVVQPQPRRGTSWTKDRLIVDSIV